MPEIPRENKIQIAPEEIRNVIVRMKKRKALRPGNIYIEHIKDSVETLIPFWKELFNKFNVFRQEQYRMIGEQQR